MAVTKKVMSDGTTRYEVTIRIDGQQLRRRFPTKRAAADFEAEQRAARANGTAIRPSDGRITLADYSAVWLETLQIRPSTRSMYECHLRNHLLPALGSRRLDQISRTDVLRFVVALERGPLAATTVGNVVNQLRTILRSAVDNGYLTRTPATRITLPETGAKKLAVLSPAEAAALLAAARPEHYAVLASALFTGLRQGELLGITEDALDLVGRRLHVERQMVTPPGAGQPTLSDRLKTRASHRVVPLPDFLCRELTMHMDTYGTGDQGLVFHNPKGAGWRRGSFNDSVWKPALRRAGVDPRYGMHAARHYYASTLISERLHVRVIQARLGHASITETMDTYGHLFPESETETSEALDRHFASLVRLDRRGPTKAA